MFDKLIQAIFALVIVITLFLIGFFVYNSELVKATVVGKSVRKQTPIFSGVKDGKVSNNEEYTTQDKNLVTFRDLPPAFNQRGGAEFSYNFWLWKNDEKLYPYGYRDFGSAGMNGDMTAINNTDEGLDDDQIILLLKGVKKSFNYNNVCGRSKTDLLVKCPVVKLERMGNYLTVEVNTMQTPDPVRENAKNTCAESSISWSKMNRHKLSVGGLRTNPVYSSNWFMVTVVVQDTMADDPIPLRNKVRVRMYINGSLELDRYVDGTIGKIGVDNPTILKQNNGNLYVLPQIEFTGKKSGKTQIPTQPEALMIADMTYFNYAITPEEIKEALNKGVTRVAADGNSVNTEKDELFNIAPVNKSAKLTAF